MRPAAAAPVSGGPTNSRPCVWRQTSHTWLVQIIELLAAPERRSRIVITIAAIKSPAESKQAAPMIEEKRKAKAPLERSQIMMDSAENGAKTIMDWLGGNLFGGRVAICNRIEIDRLPHSAANLSLQATSLLAAGQLHFNGLVGRLSN